MVAKADEANRCFSSSGPDHAQPLEEDRRKTLEKIEMSFEEALAKLEDIVKKLERGEMDLEESLKAFEEGVRLSEYCSKKLDEAEGRIQKILRDAEGKVTTKPFELGTEDESQRE